MSKNKPNPWNKNKQPQNPPKKRQQTGNGDVSGRSKFQEAQIKLQSAVEKHLKEYESSSEEEEESLDINLLDNILKQYKATGGTKDGTIKTETFIQETFLSGANTCLICISRVKRDDKIWNCKSCYGAFHLDCIQRWSKDTVMQQKQRIQDEVAPNKGHQLSWCCPKCRTEYPSDNYPARYLCFCEKRENPVYQPFVVPHSCGEICRKDLAPPCGHKCLLLCHPGPCPPCPVTVRVTCHCGTQEPSIRRCSNKGWSCQNICGRKLSCEKHSCRHTCHPGECPPCEKKSVQKCMCGGQQKLRECADPIWQCDKVCNKPLDCGKHRCQDVCHAGVCDSCPLTKTRYCPCGKSSYLLPCTKDTPTCGSTCDKLLECGVHTCSYRCHKDKCGLCLEIVTKSCRCTLHTKELQCCKTYFCETKCKKMRDCGKHPCNRKCCDGNCPPCEKLCSNTLQCGNHKCQSVCHRGPCYPCQQTKELSCRCGFTKITVVCGRKLKVKPPKCQQPCLIPPDCHHEQRVKHRCHFNECPPCKQVCDKKQMKCDHRCPAPCHSFVLVKIEEKASMPWERSTQVQRQNLPCPECVVPVPVTCLGGHETANYPCHLTKPSSCGRACGRQLPCTNHACTLECHTVIGAGDDIHGGTNCEACHHPCVKPRPEGCNHRCPLPCHSGACPPCKQMIKITCHCGLSQPYFRCADWLQVDKREELKSCGNQCPKNYDCGHRCKSNCHSGECPKEVCKKKVKVTCKCKRIKKEFQCDTVRNNGALVKCDEVCLEKQAEELKRREKEEQIRLQQEEMKNQKDLEEYQKKFSKKSRKFRKNDQGEQEETSFLKKHLVLLMGTLLVAVTSLVAYQTFVN
ncbi:NF-X1-type zinc finger protein NFXL1 [Anthonomus grandis grandis]|uniref:NF-X1-type zinc finger protein NFXL1 n=1 Tax=Anthonomus grandis grandis TaxID=2921223 RepID=UPI0021661517|nr:NF-X1-type zinc finger protein NFXL1 [Anthonomus grandis grandis]